MSILAILILLNITVYTGKSLAGPRSGFAVPRWFRAQALCIYRHENGGYGWHAHTGNGYETGLQFLPSTWARAGGRFHSPEGHFYGYSPAEIIYRGYRIWSQDGGSWREWSTARYCGLR